MSSKTRQVKVGQCFAEKGQEPLSKQNFLRRVISESIDLEKFFKAGV